MMNCLRTSWPEPIVRVQHLSDSGIQVIPDCYVKKFKPIDQPGLTPPLSLTGEVNIPVIDMQELYSDDMEKRENVATVIDNACQEWGFFQVVNHGVSHELMERTREVWREFFKLPLEEKQRYANTPMTYEGYGSRLGVQKGISLDWSDYFFMNFLPLETRDPTKWPGSPPSCRALIEEYSNEVVKLGEKLLEVFSTNLGLKKNHLQETFGAQDVDACMRVCYYPKCPQPDLALGLSPHSDPGGMTLLFPDENVAGLQVRRGDTWVTVKPVPKAYIVNIGDQLQVLSNAKYKSVEHRVIVNPMKERISLAFFYNPRGDRIIKPIDQLIGPHESPLYPAMTFNEYRLAIRTKGLHGKSQVESLKSSTS